MAKPLLPIPYVIPIQQDFRVLPRLPDSWKAGMGRNRGRLFLRSWGVELHWPRHDLGNALAKTQPRTYPYSESERIRWAEPMRALDSLALSTTPLAWEMVTQQVPGFGTFILEKIATYLRAVPLDAGGAPAGAPTITNIVTDPFADNPIPHPTLGVGGLSFSWALVQDQQPPERSAESMAPVMLSAAPLNHIPVGYPIAGIPPTWADLRYAWASPYTREHHILLSGGNSLLRFFVILSSPDPDRWLVKPGGMVSGYWQSAGRLGAALNAAVRRYP